MSDRPNADDRARILLGQAHDRLGAGDLAAAEALCRDAVILDPACAGAWNILGALLLRRRDPAAVDSFAQAVRHAPRVHEHHRNHAAALNLLGRAADAEAVLSRALSLLGPDGGLLCALGDVRMARGDAAGAVTAYRAALDHLPPGPERVRRQGSLVRALSACGWWDEALTVARDRVAASPDMLTWRDLANTLMAAGQPDAAVEPALAAVALAPDQADLRVIASAALTDANRVDEAEAQVSAALALAPDMAEAHANRGFIALRHDDAAGAATAFRAALDGTPASGAATVAAAQEGLGMALLRQGDIAGGVPHFAWRYRAPGMRPALPGVPEWDGVVRPGAALVVTATQGLGDAMHFIRYAPLLRQAGMRVVFRGMEALVDLLNASGVVESAGPLAQPLPPGTEWAQADCLALLPLAATSLGFAAGTIPYLAPPLSATQRWAGALAPLPPFRVALAWAGSTRFAYHRHRAPRLAPLLPLLDDPALAGRVGWVSVQTDDGRRDLATVGATLATRGDFLDLGAGLRTLADTAAILMQADLVIALDTGVAHLAGALGRPLWLMLDTGSEWRWFSGRTDSPWYPTARLFRQHSPGDWAGVVDDMAGALRTLVAQ
ncbi:tetratricopeptide repeat protein [Nitrospirillum pindoramense]|uniref:Tetratricopeptide repeat protein n=1 Tax=Nitrospirillum amazonense TaxID=28077 RepID=A0A560H8I4_9PROT|nr:tetratricopeptide repeat protein [Nitrospirillum amazonense]TWB42645.1 tetratricopeptide repeat protein [Nitrospirillum amazonense]